ncbi:acylamino-acid-releasing enzyme-like [Tubulanus polymorphus]|uniref:acylamino-acid-releasing enzyme-like n=1 Tax=Tubulanus polymorphus TaxID=672921 RepID=UPI003DA2F992
MFCHFATMMSSSSVNVREKMVEEVVNIYRDLAKYPTPTEGSLYNIQDKNVHVYTEWTERDIERVEKIKFTKHYILETEQEKIKPLIVTPPQEIQNELYNKISPSGKYRAVVRKFTPKKGDEKFFIEVWSESTKIKNIDILAFEKHGKIYKADGAFGTLEWSPSEEKLMYLAERKLTKTQSFFDRKNSTTSVEEARKATEDVAKGDEHLFREDWGEQLVGLHHPVICILDIETEEISVLDGIPEDLSPATPKWRHTDDGIVFIGYCHDPYRLGLIYCLQRKSSVFYFDIKSKSCSSLCDDEETSSRRAPSISPNGNKLIWLQNKVGGPHMQCSSLMQYNWNTEKTSIIVDVIRSSEDGEFPGIHAQGFPKRCWANDGRRIVITSHWRTSIVTLVINLETKAVTKISSNEYGVCSVLDVCDDYILAVRSSPNSPHHMVIGKLPAEGQESNITWYQLDKSPPVVLDDVNWSVIKHDVPPERMNPLYKNINSYESILIRPGNSTASDINASPVIIFPHGGPHSSFHSDFMLYIAGLCRCGFTIVCVNYRGSWSYGQDFIDCLPNHIGTIDVQDVQAAIEEVIDKYPVDKDKCCVLGGSHGGFLTCHLIGQYPGFYKAACARNPVTNLSTMATITDIPDWTYCESGHDYDFKCLPTPDVMKRMWDVSPMQFVDKVQTPVMIMLGKDDLRVPPKQGHEYIRALKARGVKTRLLAYPDNSHPLNKVDTEADAFVNIVHWFFKHL